MKELATLRGKAVQGAVYTECNASPAPEGLGSSEKRASPRNGEVLGSTPSSVITLNENLHTRRQRTSCRRAEQPQTGELTPAQRFVQKSARNRQSHAYHISAVSLEVGSTCAADSYRD